MCVCFEISSFFILLILWDEKEATSQTLNLLLSSLRILNGAYWSGNCALHTSHTAEKVDTWCIQEMLQRNTRSELTSSKLNLSKHYWYFIRTFSACKAWKFFYPKCLELDYEDFALENIIFYIEIGKMNGKNSISAFGYIITLYNDSLISMKSISILSQHVEVIRKV